jgi:hypothetical protein
MCLQRQKRKKGLRPKTLHFEMVRLIAPPVSVVPHCASVSVPAMPGRGATTGN